MGKSTFSDKLDTIFVMSAEAIDDHGEDNFCCITSGKTAILGSFDGCGGLGSRVYGEFQGKSGAYLSSRLASGAICDWYMNKATEAIPGSQEIITGMREYLMKNYDTCESMTGTGLKIKGSMVRKLPTTAAIALASEHGEQAIGIDVVWAGDSRVYMLNSKGLVQLSEDDLDDVDPFINLSSDAVLTNVLSSDGNFVLHHKAYEFEMPCIIISATDGCFGYLTSPMEFEYLLLNAIESTNSPIELRQKLQEEIVDITGDDSTLGFMSFGYGSFEDMKNDFIGRKYDLEKKYIDEINRNRGSVDLKSMWQEYRASYERYLN